MAFWCVGDNAKSAKVFNLENKPAFIVGVSPSICLSLIVDIYAGERFESHHAYLCRGRWRTKVMDERGDIFFADPPAFVPILPDKTKCSFLLPTMKTRVGFVRLYSRESWRGT